MTPHQNSRARPWARGLSIPSPMLLRTLPLGGLAVASLLAATSCQQEDPLLPPADESADQGVLSPEAIRARVAEELADDGLMEWTDLSDLEAFSAGLADDSLFAYGYWLDAVPDDVEEQIGRVDPAEDAWRAQFDEVLAEVLEIESAALGHTVTRERILPYGEPEAIPHTTLRLASPASFTYLRGLPSTRYVEPMGFDPDAGAGSLAEQDAGGGVVARSGSGCGSGDFGVKSTDWFWDTGREGTYAWTLNEHRVRSAWGYSNGSGVRIQIIDTGVSDDQEALGSKFASGRSAGRNPVRKLATHHTTHRLFRWRRTRDSPDDPCGHGTTSAGIAAGPRGVGTNVAGVAYGADLTSVRATVDVMITSSDETKGVRDALVIAGNSSTTKIVNMSLGTPISRSYVNDGVYYAYNRGKLIFAAAGTSINATSGFVVWPARLYQAVAVTGATDASVLTKCPTCHTGSLVEFAMVMEREGTGGSRTVPALALSGERPRYTGGTSAATPMAAGIAALVWSRNPTWSRSQVLSRLRRSGSLYPNKSSTLGYGKIDALEAVRGY